MTKTDEPRRKQSRRRQVTGAPPASTFAGNVMSMVAVALLFDEDQPRPADDDAEPPAE